MLTAIPVSLQAKTRPDLSKAMLMNNLAMGIQFKYFDITYSKDGWVCWYYANVEHELPPEERISIDTLIADKAKKD